MPTTTIPLVFQPTQRGPLITSSSPPTKDARMVRCFNTIFPNKVTRQNALYCEKMPGWATSTTPGGSNNGSAFFFSPALSPLAAFGSSTSTIYDNGSSVGSVSSGVVSHFSAGSLSGDENIFFSTNTGKGWYYPRSSGNSTTAYTADGNNSTTITNIKISGVNSTAGLYPGQKISAASNIVAGTRIVSVNSGAFTAVLDTATTGGLFTALSITKEKIALMNDTDFTAMTLFGGFVEMDGYVFAAVAQSGSPKICHSDLNSASAFDPLSVIQPNHYDIPACVAKYRNHIVYFGNNSVQFFTNNGNPSGSVLSQADHLSIIGLGSVGGAASGVSSHCLLGGTLYWLGVSEGVVSGVYRLNGFAPERISNDSVTRQLAAVIAALSSTEIIAFDPFSFFGNDFLYVAVGDIGYIYHVQTEEWYEAGFFSGGMRIAGNTSSSANPALYGVRMTGTTGKVYSLSESGLVYTDDTAAYTMTLQTEPYVLNDGKGFVINSVELLADTQASGSTAFYTTADDYANWVTQPSFDMTLTTKEVHRLGLYRNHVAFKLEHSANTAWRAQALKVRWEPCST